MMLLPKHLRAGGLAGQTLEHSQVADLLVAKDKELKHYLKLAAEQEEIQKKADALKAEVDKQDEEIRQLQRHLKDAEHVLATAIYQAKQKLNLIQRANEHPLNSEELIKYAHRISASHAVAAPYNWEVGDLRRPYPTDIEMRAGHLGMVMQDPQHIHTPGISPSAGASASTHLIPGPPGAPGVPGVPGQATGPPATMGDLARSHPPSAGAGITGFQWSQDTKPNIINLPLPGSDSRSKDNLEDVEVMSTESSSSSSSDSQ